MSTTKQADSGLSPRELANLLVEHLRAGHKLSRTTIEQDWSVPAHVAKKGIGIARTVLREEYDLFLPVAHYSNEYTLQVTNDPIEAYRGELPQIRDMNTRAERTFDRTSYVLLKLEKVNQIRARQQNRALRTAFDALDAALDNVDGWIDDQIQQRGTGATA